LVWDVVDFSKLMMFVMCNGRFQWSQFLAKEAKSSLFVVLKYKPPAITSHWNLKNHPEMKGDSSSIPSFLGFQRVVFGGVTTPQNLPRVGVRYGTRPPRCAIRENCQGQDIFFILKRTAKNKTQSRVYNQY